MQGSIAASKPYYLLVAVTSTTDGPAEARLSRGRIYAGDECRSGMLQRTRGSCPTRLLAWVGVFVYQARPEGVVRDASGLSDC
jgi:hypothetical protein